MGLGGFIVGVLGAVIIAIITWLVDSWAWNGLINAHGIGMIAAYIIALILAIVFTIAMIYVIVAILIIGVALSD
jgi:hypothetical protein